MNNFKKLIYLAIVLMSVSAVFAAVTNDDSDVIKTTLLNQDPDPAEPGKYVELRWKVEKIGTGTLEDISFELEPKYPFSIDDSETKIKKLNNWNGYSDEDEYYTLYYKVLVDNNAVLDDYDIDLLIKYKTPTLIEEKRTYNIRVDDNKDPELVSGLIKTEPVKLLPDTTDNKLSVELINLGEDDAELVVGTLSLPEGFEKTYSYSLISSVGTITGGNSKNLVFYIDVNETVKEGDYPAIITLNYRQEGKNTLLTKRIPVYLEVKNRPSFEVKEIIFNPNEIKSGNSVEMKITVINTGSKDAESVSIRAFKESSQPFEFNQKTDFIGTLKPGEEGTAVITFDVDSDAIGKEYLTDFEIRSIYNKEVYLQKENAKIMIVESQENFFEKYSLAILAIVALLAIAIYYIVKRR